MNQKPDQNTAVMIAVLMKVETKRLRNALMGVQLSLTNMSQCTTFVTLSVPIHARMFHCIFKLP